MKKINNFVRFLVDNGLLFEMNRKVLHPLGYSLEADMDETNMSRLVFSKLSDAEDPEGFTYDDESLEENLQILESFMKKTGYSRLEKRQELLGYIVQEKD